MATLRPLSGPQRQTVAGWASANPSTRQDAPKRRLATGDRPLRAATNTKPGTVVGRAEPVNPSTRQDTGDSGGTLRGDYGIYTGSIRGDTGETRGTTGDGRADLCVP